AIFVGPVLVPVIVLAIYGMTQSHGAPVLRLNGAGALLLGFGILLPVTAAASLAILAFGRQAERMVRGSYITLLPPTVKSVVDAEVVDAIRRSGPLRDPRGD